jgi:hypothetical protein
MFFFSKATSFEYKILRGNPLIFHLRIGESGSDVRHLWYIYCRHIYAPMTCVNFKNVFHILKIELFMHALAKITEFRERTLLYFLHVVTI